MYTYKSILCDDGPLKIMLHHMAWLPSWNKAFPTTLYYYGLSLPKNGESLSTHRHDKHGHTEPMNTVYKNSYRSATKIVVHIIKCCNVVPYLGGNWHCLWAHVIYYNCLKLSLMMLLLFPGWRTKGTPVLTEVRLVHLEVFSLGANYTVYITVNNVCIIRKKMVKMSGNWVWTPLADTSKLENVVCSILPHFMQMVDTCEWQYHHTVIAEIKLGLVLTHGSAWCLMSS